MKYIIIDIEANIPFDNTKPQHEIIELGAVMLNESLHPIKTFKSFVRPIIVSKLSKGIRRKTKIKQYQINRANNLIVVLEKFFRWANYKNYNSITNNYLLCSWSTSDYIMLKDNFKLYGITDYSDINLNNYCNIQEQFAIIKDLNYTPSLDHALKLLNIVPFGQKHRALNDAINASKVFINIFNNINSFEFCHICLKHQCSKIHKSV